MPVVVPAAVAVAARAEDARALVVLIITTAEPDEAVVTEVVEASLVPAGHLTLTRPHSICPRSLRTSARN